MQRTKPPFRADHVGSLLRTAKLKEAREKRARGEITPQALQEIEETKRGTDPHILSRVRALLKDPDPAIRSRVAVALTALGAVDADVLKVHLERLSDLRDQDDAADSLCRFEDRLKPFERDLVDVATHATHYSTRWLAAGLLSQIGRAHV